METDDKKTETETGKKKNLIKKVLSSFKTFLQKLLHSLKRRSHSDKGDKKLKDQIIKENQPLMSSVQRGK